MTFSQEVMVNDPFAARNLPIILKMPSHLSNNLIIVKDHKILQADNMISNEDEVYLFLAVMGG